MRRMSPSFIAGSASNALSREAADDSRRITSSLVHRCYRNGNTYSHVTIGNETELDFFAAATRVSPNKTHVVIE